MEQEILFKFLLRQKQKRNGIINVARHLGISKQAVYKWINGQSKPSKKHFAEILKLLENSL